MLKISKLSISYGAKQVLKDVSFQLERGELGCVLGESGRGKTTLLRAILGFEEYQSGHIEVGDTELSASTVFNIRQHIAYLPQELSLPSPTVREMMMTPFFFRINRGVTIKDERIHDEWKLLGLEPGLLDRSPNAVSAGQRQRIMLSVCGLLGKPLVILDEPTSALDNDSTLMVVEYLKMMARERGAAVLAVTHSDILAKHCDKALHL